MVAPVQQQFGPTADAYASSDIHARGESLKTLLQLLQPKTTWRLLDVAAGAGHTALAMARHVEWVHVLDLTPSMLMKTRELAGSRGIVNLSAILAGGERLPLPDASLDAITCRLALHHFLDIPTALSDWRRVLRPGARLGVTDNIVANDIEVAYDYNRFEAIRDPSHRWVWPATRLEGLITDAGFRVLDSLELSKEFEFEQWADRQRVTRENKAILLDMLRRSSPALRDWLAPRWEGGAAYFSLREIVILAQKPII